MGGLAGEPAVEPALMSDSCHPGDARQPSGKTKTTRTGASPNAVNDAQLAAT